jgi:predicted GNAT family acetyltransferase
MAIELRTAEPADIAQMASIRAKESGTAAFWANRIASYLSGEHSPQQALTDRAAYVATDQSQLVGFVAGHSTRRFGCGGELQWINVVEERRGMGIAGMLVAKIGEWFVEQQAARICVNVSPENTAARKLYTRCGALPLNEHWMVWEDSRVMMSSR